MIISLRKLGLPRDTVTVFRKPQAPEVLQKIDLSGEGTHILIVPDGCASLLTVNSIYSEKIRGGMAYVA